ncbi:MAG: hypothetical protein FWG98_00810 [Candidatus Cloacimonetes bacterium]|nr:hypothetical protein [Candidatus Cloacimonadota bacterium]
MKLSFIKYLPILSSLARTFMLNAKHDYKIRTFDKTKEKINTIEHLIVKLDKKIGECRNEIDNLRQQVIFSRNLNIILSVMIIVLFLIMLFK